jgi:uncharacterized membrane protein
MADQLPAETDRAQDNRSIAQARQIVVTEEYAGPLPPPQILAAYENAMPGLGKTIVDEFLKEGNHRRQRELTSDKHELLDIEMDQQELLFDYKIERTRLWLVGGISLISIAATVVLGLLGEPSAAVASGSITPLLIVVLFIRSLLVRTPKSGK